MSRYLLIHCPNCSQGNQPFNATLNDINQINEVFANHRCPLCGEEIQEFDPSLSEQHFIKYVSNFGPITTSSSDFNFDNFSDKIYSPNSVYNEQLINVLNNESNIYKGFIYDLLEDGDVTHIEVTNRFGSSASQNTNIYISFPIKESDVFHEFGHHFYRKHLDKMGPFKEVCSNCLTEDMRNSIICFLNDKYKWELTTTKCLIQCFLHESISQTDSYDIINQKINDFINAYDVIYKSLAEFILDNFPLVVDNFCALNVGRDRHELMLYNYLLNTRSASYYSGNDIKELMAVENFCNIFSMYARDDEFQIRICKSLFPEVFDDYESLISKILNDKAK